MQEQIGNVMLIYEEEATRMEQAQKDDEKILKLVKSGYDCRQGTDISWPVLYHLSHLRANLTEWLPIKEGETLLELGSDSGQLTGGFIKKAAQVVCIDKSVSHSRILATRYQTAQNLKVYAGEPWECLERLNQKFDWIVAPGLLSQARMYFVGEDPQIEALKKIQSYLKAAGHLVLVSDNRFGLKYWAGAAESGAGHYFGSLEGEGDTFSKNQLEKLLKTAGIIDYHFYYPYPERWFPTSIYSDDWLPKKGSLDKNLRNFDGERLVLFDESKVYDQLIADGRYPEFANTYLIVAGRQNKETAIFVKYSNDRSERFMIRTDIVKTANGLEVQKIPLSNKAIAHVQKMKDWEEKLRPLYKKNGILVNRCQFQEKNHIACFEFLVGRTFEERLLEIRKDRGTAAEIGEILKFKELLFRILEPELRPFKKSEIFVEMFGNVEFSKAYQGAETNNLDWVFENLLELEEGFCVIDYEWTFSVQVPVEYLLWRALSLHLKNYPEPMNFIEAVGISPDEEEIFSKMEHHFQLWLLDGASTIGEQYLDTAGKTIFLEQMIKTQNKNRMQIYVDQGAGFLEQNSFWVETEPDKRGVIHLELLLPFGTRALRLDPAEECCIVKVRRLLGELGGTYPLQYTHNGRELEEQGILYTTTDPQISICEIVEGTGRIYAELSVTPIHPDAAYACMNLLNRVRQAERVMRSRPYQWLKKLKNVIKR